MRTDPTLPSGPAKDRFRTARRAKARADRKLRGFQLFFPWFEDFAAPAAKDPSPQKIGRAAK
jgi:hypothetical protein